MTTTAKKRYIRRKFQEIIQYTEHSDLEDGKDLAINMGYILLKLNESLECSQNLRLVK